LPAGEAYESYIFNSKQCPTREGLHDFFNGIDVVAFSAHQNQAEPAAGGADQRGRCWQGAWPGATP
jgi:hypothetical protein